uniref:AA9 family lytic polysaccharide monooxygenase n=1 Tax=Volvariella volvacea TaxID=36659 RepID=A0A0K0QSH7_9AGAR|nr:copper-dependent lytic polysaccharide monooxygenase [Volvariella volvacea]
MQLKSLVVLASFAASALAHTHVWSVWVNGVDQGDGRNRYIRSPPNNNPVKDLRSSAMACNVNNRVVSNWVSVKAGDAFTFEWYHDARGDDIIDTSHKGPVQAFIAPASSNGSGNVWTKLFAEAYTGGSWAVDKLINARGKHTVYVPNVPAGDYLFRAEIAALHEADTLYSQNPVRGVQMYMSCVQVRVTTSGGDSLPAGNTFPGTYTDSTPGIRYNIYTIGANHNNYQYPGPAPWSGSPGGFIGAGSTPKPPAGPTGTTTSGGSAPTGGTVPLYGQCGGNGYTGPTVCAQGTCKVTNEWYSQCVP